jgi:hypothetical protein
MSFNRKQFRNLIAQVITDLDLYSERAVELLMGIAAKESAFGVYLKQLGSGPALGVFQIEPATEKDVWENYLNFRIARSATLVSVTGVNGPNQLHLKGNLIYQIAIARTILWRVPQALPLRTDIRAMAVYWDDHYNKNPHKGTVDEFIKCYRKYVG